MSARSILKAITPPVLLQMRRRLLYDGLRFTEVSTDWTQALRVSTGYSAASIVEQVAAATREVVAGRALYERDSVLFYEPDFPYPIATELLRAALANRGRLHVVDFGGSLGSTYRQCRPLLDSVAEVRWQIVEQPAFVSIGQCEFANDELVFVSTLQELRSSEVPSLVLLSSVLQYLERPELALTDLLELNANHLVIDRTPMSNLPSHRLCIQHAPKSVYEASYPCWILSRPVLHSILERKGWRVLAEFENREGRFVTPNGLEFEFRGLIAERQRVASCRSAQSL